MVRKKGETEGKKMAGFLYPHFQMLKDYKGNVSSAVFPKILLGWINGLISHEMEFDTKKEKLDKDTVEKKLYVIQEGQVGGLIFLTSSAEPKLCQGPSAPTELSGEKSLNKDFNSLAQDLREIYEAPKVLQKHEVSKVPIPFRILLECMEKCWNKKRRLRLRRAPFFLSAEKKVTEFIPMMYAAMKTCDGLRELMVERIKVPQWQTIVKKRCEVRVVNVLEAGHYYTNAPAFLQFLFNCKKHLVCEDNIKKWEEILNMIDYVHRDFLDHIFLLSYQCKWGSIPMLDFA